jgi:hypothetical protein
MAVLSSGVEDRNLRLQACYPCAGASARGKLKLCATGAWVAQALLPPASKLVSTRLRR